METGTELFERKVLIVDDEEINREILGNIIESKYKVDFAKDGKEALEKINDRTSGISLVLLDIIMPEFSGFDVLARMKKEGTLSEIPVIVLTSEKDSEIESLRFGAADFLTKPYDSPEVILARVRHSIELFENSRIINATEFDKLTTLYTPEFFFEYASRFDKRFPGRVMDAVAINFTRFHLLTELKGRGFGDKILCAMADGLRSKSIKNEHLYADQLRINQIFINILSNALKYTPDGNSVYVDMWEQESQKDGCVRLLYKVEDTGMGMSAEYMKEMYKPFSRETDSRINTIQGTGLGLAITKRMVDLMDGSIECISEEGKGTTFTVSLDICVSDMGDDDMSLPALDVLVIDDDEVLLETAGDTLASLGANPDLASSGEDALGKIRAKKSVGELYDVIILDWRMPGVSGVELTRKIREIAGDDVSIILVSAYDWTQIEDSAKLAGVSGFISKPLFRSSLYRKISEILDLERYATEQEEDNSELAGMNVLVVEDMDVNWEIIHTLLEMCGINSERAENGKVAVETLRDMQPARFDVVFMDIQMPVMNGLDATREIRRLENPDAAGIPIIAMTADAFSENVAECIGAGMNGHIAKPIDIKHVVKELKKVLVRRNCS